MTKQLKRYSIAAAQPGNVIVLATSKADALRRAHDGEGEFEVDDGFVDIDIRGTLKRGITILDD